MLGITSRLCLTMAIPTLEISRLLWPKLKRISSHIYRVKHSCLAGVSPANAQICPNTPQTPSTWIPLTHPPLLRIKNHAALQLEGSLPWNVRFSRQCRRVWVGHPSCHSVWISVETCTWTFAMHHFLDQKEQFFSPVLSGGWLFYLLGPLWIADILFLLQIPPNIPTSGAARSLPNMELGNKPLPGRSAPDPRYWYGPTDRICWFLQSINVNHQVLGFPILIWSC